MPSEPELEGKPPVPGVWRLAWLIFMQPVALSRMFQAWGLEGRISLIGLWRQIRARHPFVRDLMAKYALLLFAVMPSISISIAAGLYLLGIPIQLYGVAFGVAVGVIGGILGRAAVSVAIGILAGVMTGSILTVSAPAIVAAGVATGVATALMFAIAYVLAEATAGDLASGIAGSIVFGISFGVMPDWDDFLLTFLLGTFVSILFSVVVAVLFIVTEVILTRSLAWRMLRRPHMAAHLSSWLPFRVHPQISIPGLYTCLIQVAEADSTLGKDLIALTAASGQQRIAQRALVEIQARELERAARDRGFARAAELELPFLPKEADLAAEPANAPLRSFHAAARDLVAGSDNLRQRRLALERARGSLESLNVTTVAAPAPSPLAERLLRTTALWLDVIREEEERLTRQVTEHPEVPAAFIAGPPLTPQRAEDRTLFKGRADIIKLIAHDLGPDRRGVLLVVGQRRMGKTSLCNWLPTYLGTGTTIVVSNFQALSGDEHRETPHRRVLGDIAARTNGAPAPSASERWGEGLRWLEELDRTLGDRRILAVIDEVERVEDGIRDGWCSTDFLDFLRAAGDALRHIRFLLLTAYPLHRLGPHWTDRLVSVTTRTISYLDEDDARELLTRPIPEFPDIYPPGGVDLILAQTGRHPYLLQKAGDDLCRLLNSRGRLRTATLDELTEVFDGMIRDVQVFDEIWRSRTEDEQATLRRLARSDEPGDLDPAAIQLAREGYLERRGDKAAIVVPLFREWIRMNIV